MFSKYLATCVVALGAGLVLSFPASAQSRLSTTSMTCAQALATVNSAGAIVLGTGGFSYDRYVRHEGLCTHDEMGVAAWAPTRDAAQCFIGYTCESRAGRDAVPN